MIAAFPLLNVVVVAIAGEQVFATITSDGGPNEIGIISIGYSKDRIELPNDLAQRLVQKLEVVVGTSSRVGINPLVVDMKDRMRVLVVPGWMRCRNI